ncbi:MAG TPA: hypothetical protein VLC11_05550 [Gemmatimonadales bacterium]|nr:hypothetical protein [Gemmatimonadales bacterium]
MPAQPARQPLREPREPSVHELPSFRFEGLTIEVRAAVLRGEDGTWRGRLRFVGGMEGPDAERETAEIFCAASEAELWQAVRGLGSHHVRDLYRSLL